MPVPPLKSQVGFNGVMPQGHRVFRASVSAAAVWRSRARADRRYSATAVSAPAPVPDHTASQPDGSGLLLVGVDRLDAGPFVQLGRQDEWVRLALEQLGGVKATLEVLTRMERQDTVDVRERRYDMSDTEWALIQPLLPPLDRPPRTHAFMTR